MRMLATHELDIAVASDCSSYFDFHFNSAERYLDDDADHLTIIKVDDVVLFQLPLDGITADSKALGVAELMELATEHADSGSTSNSQMAFFNLRQPNFSSSGLDH